MKRGGIRPPLDWLLLRGGLKDITSAVLAAARERLRRAEAAASAVGQMAGPVLPEQLALSFEIDELHELLS